METILISEINNWISKSKQLNIWPLALSHIIFSDYPQSLYEVINTEELPIVRSIAKISSNLI